MAQLLALGDSLTWGSDPATGARHAPENRWPVALGEGLAGSEIVTEGLRGRTTMFDRHSASAEMNTSRVLPMILHSHAPLDLVLIMLGTNDIYEGHPNRLIRDGLARLVEQIRHHPWRLPMPCAPKIMLIAPPPVSLQDAPGAGLRDVTETMVTQSEALGALIQTLADDLDCAFFDAGTVGRASGLDGFHLEAEVSRALGLALQAPVAALIE